MTRRAPAATTLAVTILLFAFQAPPKPEDQLAAVLKAYFAMGQPAGWEAVGDLPSLTWRDPGPAGLSRCLANGDCFARQGTASIAGRNLVVVASGARAPARWHAAGAGPAGPESGTERVLSPRPRMGFSSHRLKRTEGPSGSVWRAW